MKRHDILQLKVVAFLLQTYFICFMGAMATDLLNAGKKKGQKIEITLELSIKKND